jgi:hypothetical protein
VRFFPLVLLLALPLYAAPPSALGPLPVPKGLPGGPVVRTPRDIKDPRIPALQGKIDRAKIFGAYDALIDIYKKSGLYDAAAQLERAQVPLYRRKKLDDAAIIHANNAGSLENQLGIYADVATTAKGVGKLYTGAPIEPVLGCYSGAFIDRDDTLGAGFQTSNWQTHRTPEQFFAKSGRMPGSLFIYLQYGRPFPIEWVRRLKDAGVIPHIAWEPKNLNLVKDDAYLQGFAKDAREADWPVFIRFASEMNGFWTPYHGNPRLYREKFRLVNRVLHQYAPRLATIWCVNNPPLANAFDYYPGDDGCDWVGVNFYSVPFHENRRDKPAFDESPLALLDPIYNRFSAKKPIAICEFAASHQSGVDRKLIPNFAIDKIAQLYGALPLRYPRVKMINWFNMDTLKYPTPGKSRNNYLLMQHPRVLTAWREATSSAHFLTSYQRLADQLPPLACHLNGLTLRGKVRLRFWSKTYTPNPRLFVALDNKIIFRAQRSGAHFIDFDLSKFRKGKHTLAGYLYDNKNRFQRLSNAVFQVQ